MIVDRYILYIFAMKIKPKLEYRRQENEKDRFDFYDVAGGHIKLWSQTH